MMIMEMIGADSDESLPQVWWMIRITATSNTAGCYLEGGD